jgi:hypothetical protein
LIGISSYLVRKEKIREAVPTWRPTACADRRIEPDQRPTDDSGRSIFRYRVGQAIACFWLLNASALRHRRVIAPINPDLLPAIAALSAARHVLSPFE